MKKLNFKIYSFILTLLIAISFSACDNDSKNQTENVQTKDTPVESEVVSEEPDIGKHKDYDKEEAECYFSYDVLIANQDGKIRGMELFDSGEGFSEFYGTELNTIKDKLGAKVNVYSMIAPTACELYCPSNMREHIDSQEDVMGYVRDMLVNVEEVNVFPTMRNHNAEEIYFRTDNRWTGLGAYYAGKVFAKTAGVDYADISEYTQKTVSTEYVGNLSDGVDNKGQADLDANPDTFIYYEPKCKFKTYFYDEEFQYLTEGKFFEEVPDSLYDSYYQGGYYCLKLTTSVKNDRKLIIVKDDFGTSLAPFLTSSFEEIYVVDIGYLGANLIEMIQEFKITDVLYVMNTFSVTGSRVYNLETLRSQATHGTLEDNAPVESDSENTESKSSDKDTETDTDSDMEFVYDIGINNPMGVIVDSQVVGLDDYYNNYDEYNNNEDEGGFDDGENEYGDYNEYYDYDDGEYEEE